MHIIIIYVSAALVPNDSRDESIPGFSAAPSVHSRAISSGSHSTALGFAVSVTRIGIMPPQHPEYNFVDFAKYIIPIR